MRNSEEDWFSLELSEVVRVNQLIRRRIDFEAFKEWYERLSAPEQFALIFTLFEFAYQAGADESAWRALTTAHLENHDQLIERAKSFLEGIFADWSKFHEWVMRLPDSERFTIFTVAVYLFGVAEGRVYRNEKKEYCNHWWHRNLLDERVVEAILNDPKYYLTSMKDDDKLRFRWRWLRGG
jgi:hypothetical protein